MKTKWKLILGIMAALVVSGILIFQALQGTAVEVHQVSREDIAVSFSEDGRLISEDERGIYSSFSARIKEVVVEEGDQVNEGDLLVVLDDRELNYQLREMEARLRGVNVQIDREAEKPTREAAARKRVLQSERDALYSQLQRLRDQLADSHIYAPMSGVVQHLQAEESGMSSPEVPLMRLYKKDGQEVIYLVEARVLTRDVLELYEGMQVKLILERRDQDLEFDGEINEIYSYAVTDVSPLGLEEERVTVNISPGFPGNLQLGLGYRVEVEFITNRQEDVLWVPQTALFRYQGEDAVMVVDNNRTRVRKVSTGLETRRETVIEEGLAEGELVILNPGAEEIDEGSRVNYTLNN